MSVTSCSPSQKDVARDGILIRGKSLLAPDITCFVREEGKKKDESFFLPSGGGNRKTSSSRLKKVRLNAVQSQKKKMAPPWSPSRRPSARKKERDFSREQASGACPLCFLKEWREN